MENYEYARNTAQYQYTKCGQGCNYLEYVTRMLGIFTAVVIFGVGVDITVHKHGYGIVLIVISLFVGFFEVTWVISLFLSFYIQEECEPELKYWEYVLWLRTWKKMFIYGILGILMLSFPYRLWLSSVACMLILWLAVLHGLLSFKSYCQVKTHTLLSTGNRYRDGSPSLNDSSFSRFMESTSIPFSPSSDNLFPLDREGVLEL